MYLQQRDAGAISLDPYYTSGGATSYGYRPSDESDDSASGSRSSENNGPRASALLHFGMHGTSEWLPGSPLGTTATSWPDVLLGDSVNAYLYACNNPSESILAKRRGFATISSHNVPPYSRAGLYKELVAIRDLLNEYRNEARSEGRPEGLAEPGSAPGAMGGIQGIPLLAQALSKAGLFLDLPFSPALPEITAADADAILSLLPSTTTTTSPVRNTPPPFPSHPLAIERYQRDPLSFLADFRAYSERLYVYLGELEGRLFSEGLHVVGEAA